MFEPNTPIRISGRRLTSTHAPEPPWTGKIIHAYESSYLVQPDKNPLPVEVGAEHVKKISA